MLKTNYPSDVQERYRAIPSVQTLLQWEEIRQAPLHIRYLKRIIQEEIDILREKIPVTPSLTAQQIPSRLRGNILHRINQLTQPRLKRVINASGIVLHTNMGRAPLAEVARRAVQEATENYCNLEINLETGRRGQRMALIEDLLCLLTGAEAALVVNNCAAAVFLVLNTLSKRREVIVSRGELVEIGGAFRMPDVMKSSGAKMVEIGTTNKTHLQDYETAITRKTGAILKVHTSNYRILGFTESVEIETLVELAHRHHLPLIYDMGSGVLEDLQQWGFPYEPLAGEMLAKGVDVITFSGDKVLGGPQAGIILGKKEFLGKIKKNHLTRALRCDKLIYAALEATLRLYLNPEQLPETLPVARMLTTSTERLIRRAQAIQEKLVPTSLDVEVVETYSQMGSGALPLEKIPSVAVQVKAPGISVSRLSKRLRQYSPPIIGYVQDDALLLNLRTVREDEDEMIVEALQQIAKSERR